MSKKSAIEQSFMIMNLLHKANKRLIQLLMEGATKEFLQENKEEIERIKQMLTITEENI